MTDEQVTILSVLYRELIGHETPYPLPYDVNDKHTEYFIAMLNTDSDTMFSLHTWTSGVEYLLTLLSCYNDGLSHDE